MDAAPPVQGGGHMGSSAQHPPVFVQVRENKGTHNGRKLYKFFLIDVEGREHLAAVGEEVGDCHYRYASQPEFQAYGAVQVHTRKDLTLWLEQVIRESAQRARGAAMDGQRSTQIQPPSSTEPPGTFFVNYRQTREGLPDGRHASNWYLQDQHGNSHLAVVGTERKDNHYTYEAVGHFAVEHPLVCNNQASVLKWIEGMITGQPPGESSAHRVRGSGEAPAAGQAVRCDGSAGNGTSVRVPGHEGSASLDAAQSPAAATGPQRSQSQATAQGQAASGKGLLPSAPGTAGPGGSGGKATGGGRAAGSKHRLVGVAQDAHMKRLRRLAAEGEEALRAAQAAHLTRLRRAAEVEATSREAIRRSAAGWVRGALGDAEAAVLAQWHQQLKQLLREANKDVLQQVRYRRHYLEPDLNKVLAHGVQHVELRAPQPGKAVADNTGTPRAQEPAQAPEQQQVEALATLEAPAPLDEPGAASATPGRADIDEEAGCSVATARTAQPERNGGPAADDGGETLAPSKRGGGGKGGGGRGDVLPIVPVDAQACGPPPDATGVLRSEPHTVSTWTYADPHYNQHGVRLVMECLREVAALLPPLQVLLSSDVIDTVQEYAKTHPHPAVAGLARHILGTWQRSVLAKLHALASPALLEDPVAQLEARVLQNQVQYPQDVVAKLAALQASKAALGSPATSPCPPLGFPLQATPQGGDPPPVLNPASLELVSKSLSAWQQGLMLANGQWLPAGLPQVTAPLLAPASNGGGLAPQPSQTHSQASSQQGGSQQGTRLITGLSVGTRPAGSDGTVGAPPLSLAPQPQPPTVAGLPSRLSLPPVLNLELGAAQSQPTASAASGGPSGLQLPTMPLARSSVAGTVPLLANGVAPMAVDPPVAGKGTLPAFTG